MTIRYPEILFILLILLAIITACSPSPAAPTNAVLPPSPTPSESPFPNISNTPSPAAPSDTPDDQVVLFTNEPPEIILTAMNLQLDDQQAQLTQSSDQIATMSAQIEALETQVAAAPTNNANNSSGSNNEDDEYDLPSNVYTVVTTQKAVVFIPVDYNKKGVPVMSPYVPRTTLEAGREAWVYKTPLIADGGTPYYESYDPDGESNLKVYFKASQIQIRLPNGKPDPDNYPKNVAKGRVTKNTVLFRAYDYDKEGKPAMTSVQPLVRYLEGDYEIVYPEYVVATGGEHYYPVYDPDGNPSGYLRAIYVIFPTMWE